MRREFIAGIKAVFPILVGTTPFGLIYGVLALDAGIPRGAAQAMSFIVFAGSSQFVATQLYHLGSPPMVMVLTIAVVNLRHLLYSASIAPYMQHLRPNWKWLLAYLLTDEAYAVSIVHYQSSPPTNAGSSGQQAPDRRHWYFLGAGLGLWGSWQLATALGILLGETVPPGWSLDFTLALTFIALLVPLLKDRPMIAAAMTAGAASILAFALPYKLGLVAASLVGIVAGLFMEKRR
jgi:4-azaleucine resistance transporter AzlC